MKFSFHIGCMIVCIVLVATASPGSEGTPWRHFANNDDVRALCQTGDTLWVGTNGGVLLVNTLTSEIDGRITADERLPGNSVRVITRRGKSVLVGTDDGLATISTDGSVVDTRALADVRTIAFGPNTTTYVGTFGHGVVIHDGAHWERLTRADSLLDDKVYAIALTDTHRIYYATSLGLCAFKDTVWASYQAGAGLPRGEVRALRRFDDERFYALIAGRGIYRFNFTTENSIRIRLGSTFVDDEVADIDVDRDGVLWAAGRYGGIAAYRDGRWERYGDDDGSLAAARWRTVHAGADGTVFVGGADGRIAAIRDGAVNKISIPSSLPSGVVGPIASAVWGREYVANGPYVLSTTEGADSFSVELEIGSVFAITTSPIGDIWVASPWGLVRNDGERWVEVQPDIEPKAPQFVSLAFGPANHLWVGGSRGEVYRFDGGLWVEYADRRELTNGPIAGIVEDGRRQVWVASGRGVLHRFDGASWHEIAPDFDGAQRLALGSTAEHRPIVLTDNGLWMYGYEEADWERVPTPDTREVGSYRAVVTDASGRIYLGTSRHIVVSDDGGGSWARVPAGLAGLEAATLHVNGRSLWVGLRRDGIARISLETLWENKLSF